MSKSSSVILRELASELLKPDYLKSLKHVADTNPLDIKELVNLDNKLGGPGLSNINEGDSGRYDIDDRAVFRPFQYCVAYFSDIADGREWMARYIVQMSILHIESLIKLMDGIPNSRFTLGTLIKRNSVRDEIGSSLAGQVERLVLVQNAAKHDVSHKKDTHMFTPQDAAVAYIVCKAIGSHLFCHVHLATPLIIFDQAKHS